MARRKTHYVKRKQTVSKKKETLPEENHVSFDDEREVRSDGLEPTELYSDSESDGDKLVCYEGQQSDDEEEEQGDTEKNNLQAEEEEKEMEVEEEEEDSDVPQEEEEEQHQEQGLEEEKEMEVDESLVQREQAVSKPTPPIAPYCSKSLVGLKGVQYHPSLRHKKVFRDNDRGITKPAIRRLARRAGVKRLSGHIYDDTRRCLKDFLGNIIGDAVAYTEHARRKTVTAEDICNALRRRNKTLYM